MEEQALIVQMIMIAFAVLSPVVGVLIGLLLARNAKRRREAKWKAMKNPFGQSDWVSPDAQDQQ